MTSQTRTYGARFGSLIRAEFILLRRNSIQLFYAFIMPIAAPFLFRSLSEDEGVDGILAATVTMILLFGLVFVSYYNPLSAIVTRREQSVLLRLRAGEVSAPTILTAIAAPGFIIGLLMAAATIAVSVQALDLPVPTNIPLILLTLVLTVTMLIVFAYATAIVTRTAESAQITSMPIIMIALLGAAVPLLPESDSLLYEAAQFLPTAPVAELLAAGWFGPADDLVRPILIIVAWIALAALYCMKSFRWAKRA